LGQAKQKALLHRSFLELYPFCAFCGGDEKAVTVDHVPPIIVFAGRQRPKGLEFPACAVCNNGTRISDLVAAFLARIYPDTHQAIDEEDVVKILAALQNNAPSVLLEMKMGRAAEKLGLRSLPVELRDGGLLRLDGPIVSKMLKAFAYKIGLALYFEETCTPLPPDGEIAVRPFSNVEKFSGEFPDDSLNFLGSNRTLQQGRKHVGDQFLYATALSDDKKLGAFFAGFRMSFSVLAFVSATPGVLQRGETSNAIEVFNPKQIRELILSLDSMVRR
jgi:hypothetical protein